MPAVSCQTWRGTDGAVTCAITEHHPRGRKLRCSSLKRLAAQVEVVGSVAVGGPNGVELLLQRGQLGSSRSHSRRCKGEGLVVPWKFVQKAFWTRCHNR